MREDRKKAGFIALAAVVLLLTGAISAAAAARRSSRTVPREKTEEGRKIIAFADSVVALADAKMSEYDFGAASDIIREGAEACPDTLVKGIFAEALFRSENGISLRGQCEMPEVIARRRFSRDEFYLYYPLPDHSWHRLSVADSLYLDNPYYSEPAIDSLDYEEAFPKEVFPMFAEDRMYFSANDLYGMGGYDLYCREKDELRGTWGEPRNLGFPYSSPGNDYLFLNTGKYVIFASDRSCGADSVDVYVLVYEPVPLHYRIDSPAALRELCELEPDENPMALDNGEAMKEKEPVDEQTARYFAKVREVQGLRDSIADLTGRLAALRDEYVLADDRRREEISAAVLGLERDMPALNVRIAKAGAELQKIEMEFLVKGVSIDPGKLAAEADMEIVGEEKSYTFTKKNPGNTIIVRAPEKEKQ